MDCLDKTRMGTRPHIGLLKYPNRRQSRQLQKTDDVRADTYSQQSKFN